VRSGHGSTSLRGGDGNDTGRKGYGEAGESRPDHTGILQLPTQSRGLQRNAGSALGPLLAAFIVLPKGQRSIAWFSIVALLAITILMRVGAWYKAHRTVRSQSRAGSQLDRPQLSPEDIKRLESAMRNNKASE